MTRSLPIVMLVAVFAAGCAGGGAPASRAPSPTADAIPPAASPSATAPAISTATVIPMAIPPGRILFHRFGSDGVERYFTINTDGTNERAIFTSEGCACARWSADWTHVLTLDATGLGTWSFTTMRSDGSDKVVITPPIKTLNLAPGSSTADGRQIVFAGWDEKDPSHNGVYLAAPDLTDLRLVMALQEGWKGVAPFGLTPDGSRVVFLAETGPEGGITHAGDLFVVNADGSGLRQLNPQGTKSGDIGMPPVSLSPDGRQAAFGVDDAVFVVDLDGGEARRITKGAGFVWAVSWSPTGEWITYTRFHDATSVVALVRPDGTDQHEISPNDERVEANAAVWSPDGKYLLVPRDSDSSVDGPRDLWIMDLEGNFIGQVTHEPSNYGTYSWAPPAALSSN